MNHPTHNIGPYTVEGRIYYKESASSWEYRVFLYEDGSLVDSWDSFVETFNNVQTLTKEQAENAIEEITNDVHSGDAHHWFDVPRL